MPKINALINILQEIQETGKLLLSEEEVTLASKSRFVFIRALVAEILFYYPSDFACPLALSLLSDKNSDVRSSAAIGLSESLDDGAFIALKKAFLNDRSAIVRAYAGSSFINNHNFDEFSVILVENTLLKEKSFLVRALCYGELYKREPNERFLEQIMRCYNSKIYQTRCAVLNVLDDILNEMNAKRISESVAIMLKKEKIEFIYEAATLLQKKAIGKTKTGDGSLS